MFIYKRDKNTSDTCYKKIAMIYLAVEMDAGEWLTNQWGVQQLGVKIKQKNTS
jgi:hypothetical protein